MKDKRTKKQKELDRQLTQEINFSLFGIKPKKRIYQPDLDEYKCIVCKTKFDKRYCDKIGKTTHCGKSLVLKRGYVIG